MHTQTHTVSGPFLIQRVSPAARYLDPRRERVRFGAREGVSDELGAHLLQTL